MKTGSQKTESIETRSERRLWRIFRPPPVQPPSEASRNALRPFLKAPLGWHGITRKHLPPSHPPPPGNPASRPKTAETTRSLRNPSEKTGNPRKTASHGDHGGMGLIGSWKNNGEKTRKNEKNSSSRKSSRNDEQKQHLGLSQNHR